MTEYDDLETRIQAAFTLHENTYSRMHPPPVKNMAGIGRTDLLTVMALAVMVTASVIVSGSRTVIEFGGGLVGVAAFSMLEITIVAYAFFITRRMPHRDNRTGHRLAKMGLYIALAVTLVANVHATLKQNGTPIPEAINTVILLFVAVSAPLLAYTSGHILGIEAVTLADRKSQAATEFDAAIEAWRSGMLRSWQSQKARLGIRVEVMPESLSALVSNVSADTPDKLTPSQQKVYDYLDMNPNSASLGVRELADITQTNRDAASKGKGMWLRNQQ